ncbi:MAG: hypothetical protein ABI131_11385 [Nostocoides sp.]
MKDRPSMLKVLASAARLQTLVPDAVLVGGTGAALHAGHRQSFDHDHVLTDLAGRYAIVLEAVEASEGWATSIRASSPPLTLLGSLDGIQAGLRQLRRKRPLETERHQLAGSTAVTVPTLAEMLRVKAFLVVQRNATRDYLDTAALADRTGLAESIAILSDIDDYYVDRSEETDSVLTALVLNLAEPDPRDSRVTRQLAAYRGLAPRWHDWGAVVEICRQLADGLLRVVEGRDP